MGAFALGLGALYRQTHRRDQQQQQQHNHPHPHALTTELLDVHLQPLTTVSGLKL